jgi:hypothetical protein
MKKRRMKVGPFQIVVVPEKPKGEGLHSYEFIIRAPKEGSRAWRVYRTETSPYLARVRFATVERHPGTAKPY